MKIQVWSDIMCPFCYIGKSNLEKALSQSPFGNNVEIEWMSFQLDPSLKDRSGTKNIRDYMNNKGFTDNRTTDFLNQLTEMGKVAGVTFQHEKTIVADTFLAHQLLHLAKSEGKSNEAEELLFKAHFQEGKNIADIDVLVALAEKLEIDGKTAREAITSGQFEYGVKLDIMQAKNMGITGVPFFVLDNKYGISGAQPVEVFLETISRAFSEKAKPLEHIFGDDDTSACSIDGCGN